MPYCGAGRSIVPAIRRRCRQTPFTSATGDFAKLLKSVPVNWPPAVQARRAELAAEAALLNGFSGQELTSNSTRKEGFKPK